MVKHFNTRNFGLLASILLLVALFFSWQTQAQVGLAFPDLQFQDEKGKTHTLSQEQGKVKIVHFWATWCAPCVAEFPQISDIQAKYRDQGLEVIAISTDGHDSVPDIKEFYAKHHIEGVEIFTDDGSAMRTLRLKGLPTTFFVSSDGKLLDYSAGPVIWDSRGIKVFLEHNLQVK